jgi:hypothetical protein
MNYVEALLQADKTKADEKETKVIKSRRLAHILGEEEPVEIKLQQIPTRRVNEIVARQFDKKGNFDMSQSYDAKLLLIVEGVIDPPIKNPEVREYFGAPTPSALADKLFGREVSRIALEVSKLSGVDLTEEEAEEAETEIKN